MDDNQQAEAARQHWRAIYDAGNAAGWRARADSLRREADICDARARAGARCCNPDCERDGTVYVGDLTTLGDYACSLCEVYIVGDGNDD